MSLVQVRDLLSPPHMAPVIEYVARECGITTAPSAFDATARIDPLELAQHAVLRAFGLKLIADAGWTMAFHPPAVRNVERQTQAESDGGVRGEG